VFNLVIFARLLFIYCLYWTCSSRQSS